MSQNQSVPQQTPQNQAAVGNKQDSNAMAPPEIQPRIKLSEEELKQSKTSYEALNSQLVDELPALIELTSGLFSQCVQQFILARKLYVGSCTKELLAIMEVKEDFNS